MFQGRNSTIPQPYEAGARQLQSQLPVLLAYVRPDPFKDIAGLDVEDADDELFNPESDAVTEVV